MNGYTQSSEKQLLPRRASDGYWCVILPGEAAHAILGNFDPCSDGRASAVQKLCTSHIAEAGPGNTFFATATCSRCREIKSLQDQFATMYVDETEEGEVEDAAAVPE
jgi:hypothetical protein